MTWLCLKAGHRGRWPFLCSLPRGHRPGHVAIAQDTTNPRDPGHVVAVWFDS